MSLRSCGLRGAPSVIAASGKPYPVDYVSQRRSQTAAVTSALFGAVAIVAVCLGIVWLLSKKMRLRHLAELRKKLNELAPTDPEYGPVRALYTSMVIDAERWGFLHSGSGDSNGGGHHVGSDHAAESGGGSDGH